MDTYEFHDYNEANKSRNTKRILMLVGIITGIAIVIGFYYFIKNYNWSNIFSTPSITDDSTELEEPSGISG